MKAVRLYQAAVIVGFVLLLEVLCLTGTIDKVTMPPPHVILRDFVLMIVRGQYASDIGTTMLNVFIAFVSAFVIGILTGTILHGYKTALDGLDRVPNVLKKTARISRLSPLETALRVTLPFCAPYLLTAAKLALAYAFIGVIGSEFILARAGMGYEIGFAYTNFDNATMYPLILLILLMSIVANGLLSRWEKLLLTRQGQQ